MPRTSAAWVLLVALGAAGARAEDRAPGALDRALGSLASPGALAEAHGHLEGLSACTECHAGLDGTPDALCVDCHEPVRRRMDEGLGAHGGFEGPCRSCHGEHRGRAAGLTGLDPATFNHERALFALRGGHVEARCEACHEGAHPETGRVAFRALGLAYESCADCHEDPHPTGFGAGLRCADCHGETAWQAPHVRLASVPADTGFLHDRDTAFALTGRHADVACAACHPPAEPAPPARPADADPPRPGAGVPTTCAGCHEDPHRAALGDDCARCHTTDAWSGPDAGFDHERMTSFPLDALHGAVACDACHRPATFAADATTCEGCHTGAVELLAGRFAEAGAAPDPHAGRTPCRGCHPSSPAAPRLIDHERACLECHDASYGALLATRKTALDELVVRAEASLRRDELAAARGERAAVEDARALRERIERLARSGLHHPDLAEDELHRILATLGVQVPVRRPD